MRVVRVCPVEDRFGRHEACARCQGAGLGLSIAVTLVEAHAGSIDVESEIGVGTTFRVVLPMSKAAELVAA
jgi:signal transduction histidine kinase